jgi:hypothetical protein
MKKNQICMSKTTKKNIHALLDELFDYCYVDYITGRFHCKKCKNIVYIDLSKKLVFCPVHGLLI